MTCSSPNKHPLSSRLTLSAASTPAALLLCMMPPDPCGGIALARTYQSPVQVCKEYLPACTHVVACEPIDGGTLWSGDALSGGRRRRFADDELRGHAQVGVRLGASKDFEQHFHRGLTHCTERLP